LLTLALLLGSDYDCQGIQGIGREYALKFLQAIPVNMDPIDYLRTVLSGNNPQNKYEQKIVKENKKNLQHFEQIIKEYSSLELENLPLIASIASIKWLKPVRVKQLQLYMKKKLGWIESYTFIKVRKCHCLFSH
jgi:5'-3' exonuclease